jgi:hypothetical protein
MEDNGLQHANRLGQKEKKEENKKFMVSNT